MMLLHLDEFWDVEFLAASFVYLSGFITSNIKCESREAGVFLEH